MKTFKEYLIEHSMFNRGVDLRMTKLGYKRLGRGVDQTAYHKSGDNFIIKIFGTSQGSGGNKDHDMFKVWFDYCKANHSNNKFLPKFYDWSPFDFDTKGGKNRYLQIKMELLKNVPTEFDESLSEIASLINDHSEWGPKITSDKLKTVKDMKSFPNRINDHHAQMMLLLHSEKDFDLMVKTIKELVSIAKKKNYEMDLHYGNFMMRGDSTPVIVDPWVA